MLSTKKNKVKDKVGMRKLSTPLYGFLYELFGNLSDYFWKKYYKSL